MANIVRGFRRAGWVITVPVAAIIILYNGVLSVTAPGYALIQFLMKK